MNSTPSPSRSANRHSSNGLQLQEISHLPIIYPPSREPSLRQDHSPRQSQRHASYADEDEDDDDGSDWEVEREYIDVGAANSYGVYGPRPHPVHRDSQDVVFGNRLTSMRSLRTRPWEVNVRLPHMHKQLARGKTVLLRTLRGGLRRVHVGHGHLGRNGSNGSPPFEFRDPQPAPQSIRQQYAELAPSDTPSANTQTDGAAQNVSRTTPQMTIQNGLLAPPTPATGPFPAIPTDQPSMTAPGADNSHPHSRSQSASYHSQARANTSQALRPRSRSVGSRHSHHSHRSTASAEATLVQHSSQMHGQGHGDADEDEDTGDTAETTLVQHVNDLTLTPMYLSPSKSKSSKKSSKFTLLSRPSRTSSVYPSASFHHDTRFSRPRWLFRSRHHPARFIRYKKPPKAYLVRAVEAFKRLPWMAAPEYPPGWLIPSDGSPPRIAKDFVPAHSDRAKLRGTVAPGTGLVYKKNGISVEELEREQGEGEEGRSWYRPSTKQVQRAARAQQQQYQRYYQQQQHGLGLGLGSSIARPVRQAYASYRAVSRQGRPLDYMYAPAAAASVSMRSVPVSRAASSTGTQHYTTRYEYSGYPYAGEGSAVVYGGGSGAGGDAYGRPRPGSIAAAASAYLSRSASNSQASGSQRDSQGRRSAVEAAGSGGSGAAGTPASAPPVPPKSGATQAQGQQQMAYTYAYPTITTGTNAAGQPVQYYAYTLAYPQTQTQTQTQTTIQPYAGYSGSGYLGYRAHVVPGSSPPLPAVPATTTSYTGSASRHGHGRGHSHNDERERPVQVLRSESANGSANGSVPTIPTTQSASASGTGSSAYSYTHPHGHGHGYRDQRVHGHPHHTRHAANVNASGSGSGSSAESYGTVVQTLPMQYANYAYSYPR